MKSHLTTKELSTLRKKLPHGSIKRISELTGLDQSTVSKVLRGDFQNESVIEQTILIIEEANSKSVELKNRISQL